jgi:hypothetical protein
VQRDPHTLDTQLRQLAQRPLARIERLCVHTAALQRRQHRRAADQRDVALAGVTAEQYRDAPELRGIRGAVPIG